MEMRDLVNFGKGLVEGYLEKALELARSAETQYRKAVETWNFLADMVPFPIPKLGGVEDPYEPYEPPPAPDFAKSSAVPVPAPAPAPVPAPAARAEPEPKADPKPEPKAKAEPPRAEPKPKAEPPRAEAAKAEAAKAEAAKAEAAKAEAAKAVPTSRSALGKLKKVDLQKLAREQGVRYAQADTVAVLVERILEKVNAGKTGPAA
jgi:hypothetical protein